MKKTNNTDNNEISTLVLDNQTLCELTNYLKNSIKDEIELYSFIKKFITHMNYKLENLPYLLPYLIYLNKTGFIFVYCEIDMVNEELIWKIVRNNSIDIDNF